MIKRIVCTGGAVFIVLFASLWAQEKENSGSDKPRMKGIFDEAIKVQQEQPKTVKACVLDNFEKPSRYNLLRGITNVYQMAPSRVMMSTVSDTRDGVKTNVLKLKFLVAAEGGPLGKGGWCGYYTSLKDVRKKGKNYFSAVNYTYLTLWVRGETGGENFVVGLADKHWEFAGDTVKANQIITYLPEKQITQKWQKAQIPLNNFFLDLSKLASLAICFEKDCFPEGSATGIVYIDDIAFE